MIVLKHKDITEKIIGAAFEVHKTLGNGYQEVIYQRAFHYELNKLGLIVEREKVMEIYYKDIEEPIGERRADFLINGVVLIEIKAMSKLDDVHFAQLYNYLVGFKLEVGLLINFGGKSLEFKRIVN
jgi:GxxExxY protein